MSVETITTVLDRAPYPWWLPQKPGVPKPGRYDLTTLDIVRDELSVNANDTSNDAFFARAITQASTAIQHYCNRSFAIEAVKDQIFIQQDPYPWQVPGGVFALQLARWPLALTEVLALTGNTNSSTVIDGIKPNTTGLCQMALVFAADGSIPAGARAKQVGPNSIVLDQPAIDSETALALTTGLQVIQQLSATVFQTLVYGTDFTIDAKRGWLIRLNNFTGVAVRWESEPVTVQYQAGYSEIPADLVEATLRLVTARFKARGRDPMLVQRDQPRDIGSERFWVGGARGQVGVLPPDVVGLVDHYRVPTIG